jgi:hypothetical protein
MIWHFPVIIDLTKVVEPGLFGGVALLVIQIFYLPNLAIASLSYLLSSGLTLGEGTLISPWVHRINELPAIPVLGALPVGISNYTYLLSLFVVVIVIALGVGVSKFGRSIYQEKTEFQRFIASLYLVIFLLTLLAANLANGQLLSTNLQAVGPIWWLMPLVLVLNLAIGSLGYIYIPLVMNRIVRNRKVTN